MHSAELPPPEFSTEGMFIAKLRRPNQRKKELEETVRETVRETVGEKLNPTAASILKLINISPYITRDELAEKLKMTVRGIEYNLKILKDNNHIHGSCNSIKRNLIVFLLLR